MGKLKLDDEPKYKRGYGEDEEEDPEAGIFDDEFGKPISKGVSKPGTTKSSRNSTQNNLRMGDRDDYESEPSADKWKGKTKEPATQKSEVAVSQGKRIRGIGSQIKGVGKGTLMDFF